MPLTNHYYYNEETCEFIPVAHNRSDLIIYTACIWILNGIVLAGVGLSLLSNYIGTPAELALKAENMTLIQQMDTAQRSIAILESQMESIIETDNEMYRSILGLDPVSPDERLTGTGGTDPYADFDAYSEETTEILRRTFSRLDNLERRIGFQQVSFDEIRGMYNENRELLKSIPAIKPVNGILLSGFGMRIHPVLNYRRMHEGLDFRAEIGTPVYATGNGTISSASRRGSYGLLIEIRHDDTYETRYAHLSRFADGIRSGREVTRGELIGYSGNTGLTQGPHLHYEVVRNGQAIDPLNYLISDTTPEEFKMYQDIARTNPMSMD